MNRDEWKVFWRWLRVEKKRLEWECGISPKTRELWIAMAGAAGAFEAWKARPSPDPPLEPYTINFADVARVWGEPIDYGPVRMLGRFSTAEDA